jgi:hypothetical protein
VIIGFVSTFFSDGISAYNLLIVVLDSLLIVVLAAFIFYS